ncbi:hypothetical protein QBC37DRAFT_417559 [Rhypophila decipiens]|uniref:Uncharacterized protein n=1 Tax=Rhypophila decipiens TaxID=261697 RepID=A0AAN6YE65_9PEZI|nr:hypothetical protein QBC37DRAFT_417559 [Rhypophila decipiens]
MSQLLGQGKSKAAAPTPSHFLHPSPAASHASLPGMMAAGPGMPGALSSQQHLPLSTTAPGTTPTTFTAAGDSLKMASSRRKDGTSALPATTAAAAAGTAGPALNLNIPLKLSRGESTRATDRTDALWAEMQATLEEVELSAGGGTRVFGPDHDRKLGELRLAQIALAQAWARSEADDAIETGGVGHTKASAAGATTDGGITDATAKTDAGGAATGTEAGGGAKSSGSGSARPGSSGAGMGSGGEETDHDILLARKRREANDRYFQRVNHGVLDVVAKLEEVAKAMRAVEQESKEYVWGDGDNESAPQSAKS